MRLFCNEFVEGLKPEIQSAIRLHKLRTVDTAVFGSNAGGCAGKGEANCVCSVQTRVQAIVQISVHG